MPLATKAVKSVTERMPKVISPRVHAVIDYVTAGTFLALGFWFWGRNRRASIAAIGCGAVEVATSLMTDYPGGVADKISFPTHGRIDAGMAGAVAALPNILGFSDEAEAKYFRMLGMNIAGVTGMTDFGGGRTAEEADEAA